MRRQPRAGWLAPPPRGHREAALASRHQQLAQGDLANLIIEEGDALDNYYLWQQECPENLGAKPHSFRKGAGIAVA
jgi:hypothetical protein